MACRPQGESSQSNLGAWMDVTANSTVDRDTVQSPLALACALHCERSVARGNTVSGNVLRAHDSGNSPEANADGCLRPKADFGVFELWLPIGPQLIYNSIREMFITKKRIGCSLSLCHLLPQFPHFS